MRILLSGTGIAMDPAKASGMWDLYGHNIVRYGSSKTVQAVLNETFPCKSY